MADFARLIERLNQVADVLKRRPADVRAVLDRLHGDSPHSDPVWLASAERKKVVQQAADNLGVSAQDLLLILQLTIRDE